MQRWLAVLLIFSAGLAYAAPFGGPYLSVNAGMANAHIQTTDVDPNDTDSPIHFTAGSLGFIGSVQLGYAQLFQVQQLLMALEGSFNYQPTESYALKDKTTFLNKIHAVDGFGLSARLGWLLHHNTLLYLIFGVNWQAFSLQLTDESPKKMNNVSLRQLGYRVGVGSETFLSQRWLVDIQVDYFNYGTFSHQQNHLTVTASPQFLVGSIGLVYIF